MEIKYTLEILTKDIQDIEKSVGKLQNSTDGSTLDLDLALSKLRNVYDVLTEIREDMRTRPGDLERAVAEHPGKEKEETAKAEEQVAEPVKEQVVEKKDEPLPKASSREGKGIIAEKFLPSDSINENLAAGQSIDKKSKVIGQSIKSISKNIGINDRFLIIRELFDGDADGFGKLIEKLDQAGDLDSATSLLDIVFENTLDHEGVSILSNLVKRRYPQS